MKNSKQVCFVLVVSLVVLGAYQHGKLNADSAVAPAKIGVVNMAKVFENSAKNKQWKETMQQKQVEMKNQLSQMQQEIEAIQENLRIRTPGSKDFLELRQQMAEKAALYDAREAVYREKINFEKQQWIEGFHQQLLEVSAQIAKDKGLDIVMTDELADFVQMTKSKVLLYHNSRYDLTDEALAAIDKAK